MGQRRRGEAAIGLIGLPLQVDGPALIRLLPGGGQRERRLGAARRGQGQRLAPVAGAERERLPLLPQPGGAGLRCLGLSCQALGGRPILALDRLPQQATQAEELRILPRRKRQERLRRRLVPPREALGLGGQDQDLRRVAQLVAGPARLQPRLVRRAGGERHQGARQCRLTFSALARIPPRPPRRRPAAQRGDAGQDQVQRQE